MMPHRSWLAVLCLLAAAAIGPAQTPGSVDAEGNYIWPNKLGRYPLKRKGVWRIGKLEAPTGNLDRLPAAAAAEVQAMSATLDRLGALFQATPEAGILQGYWMKEARSYVYPQRSGQPPEFAPVRLPFSFDTGFFPFPLEDIVRNGEFVPFWGQVTNAVYFRFNLLPGPMNRKVIAREKLPNEHEALFYLRPRVTATWKGFPLLEGEDLLIAREGRDPWSPVSHGRALKACLPLFEKDKAGAEQRLAGLKKKNEETQSPAYEAQMRAHLEKYSGQLRATQPDKWKVREASMLHELNYNRELAAKQANPQRDKDGAWYWSPLDAHAGAVKRISALTPAEAAAPACFLEVKGDAAQGRYALPGDILPAGANPSCEPLVSDNHAYFDPKLPRSEPQILVVRSIGTCGRVKDGKLIPNETPQPGKVAHGCARHPIYWEQMDWTKVAALVRP